MDCKKATSWIATWHNFKLEINAISQISLYVKQDIIQKNNFSQKLVYYWERLAKNVTI